jgi:hypothetical protein
MIRRPLTAQENSSTTPDCKLIRASYVNMGFDVLNEVWKHRILNELGAETRRMPNSCVTMHCNHYIPLGELLTSEFTYVVIRDVDRH